MSVSGGSDYYFFVTVTASMAAAEQLLQTDDSGEDQGELGDDESFTGEESETAEGQRDQGSSQQKGDEEESVHLLLLATLFAVEGALELGGGWKLDLYTGTQRLIN